MKFTEITEEDIYLIVEGVDWISADEYCPELKNACKHAQQAISAIIDEWEKQTGRVY